MRLVVAKSQFEHKIKIPLVWGIFYYQTHKKKRRRLPAGVSECPERKERRKRNGHSKLSSGAQSPEERECRRESESLDPIGGFHPVAGAAPFDESKCNTYLCICQVFLSKLFFSIFFRTKNKILGNRPCCLAVCTGIKSISDICPRIRIFRTVTRGEKNDSRRCLAGNRAFCNGTRYVLFRFGKMQRSGPDNL